MSDQLIINGISQNDFGPSLNGFGSGELILNGRKTVFDDFSLMINSPSKIDLISKNSQTDTSAGTTGYLDAANAYVTVAAEEPLINQRGNTNHPTFEQFLTSPLSPANQTTASLAPGEYFLWILGGGSVAVSANTATVTGAGSATEATGVNFQVTVAGTVDIAITGECTHFHLTDGTVSLYPIFHNAVGIVPTRAGTTKLADISTDFPKFRDSLGGVADGVELVTINPDFNQWFDDNPISYLVINEDGNNYVTEHVNGARFVSNNTQPLAIANYSNTIPSSSYEYTLEKSDHVSGDVRLRIQDTTSFVYILDATNMGWDSNGIKKYRFNTFSTSTQILIQVYRDKTQSTDYVMNSWGLKQISPAASRHTFTWTPGVDFTDHTTVESIMTPSDADGFLKASAAGGFELSDGTNTLRWPPTVGDDIPRSWVQTAGSGATITGDVIDFVDETCVVRDDSYWIVGKAYRINSTLSNYSGAGNIYLPYDRSIPLISANANGVYEYDYSPNTLPDVAVYSDPGHTATVTINSIYELAPYQFEAGVPYEMEIIYGTNVADGALKQEINVYIEGAGWISVKGDYDGSYDIDTDWILGLDNPYQSSVKNHVAEKLMQSHWRS